jgi:hypothetical protein
MAATRIVAFFNLKPDIAVTDYEDWAAKVDLPTVNALPSIENFEVLRATAKLGGGSPEYQYIEILDINDMDQFRSDVSSPQMQSVAGAFRGMVDVSFLVTEPLKWRAE